MTALGSELSYKNQRNIFTPKTLINRDIIIYLPKFLDVIYD